MLNWTAAAAAAWDVADGWERERGPGGAVLLFDAAGLREEACGGLASLDTGVAFSGKSVVRYASISKHFLCGLLLADDPGVMEATLGSRIDVSEAMAGIPVGRALDMTAGLADTMETLWLLGVSPTASMTKAQLLAFARGLEGTNFAPGAEISYSNTGYRLMQAALEARGIDYGAALRTRFFEPFGLGMAFPEDETDPVAQLATGYWKSPRGWLRGRYGLHVSASGGITGSGRDLARWCRALLANEGPAAGLLARLSADRTLNDGTVTGYGLGMAVSPVPGVRAVGHGGSLPGFKNHFLLAPALGAGVVVVSNREETDAHGIAMRVMAALADAPMAGPAVGVLPEGRFVDEAGGPAWLEHAAGVVTFLGAGETVFPGEGGAVVSRSVHQPMTLRAAGGGITGAIGHRGYRFRPVDPAARAPAAWAGTWSHAGYDARFHIDVADGVATLTAGTGPQRTTTTLVPLSPKLALADRPDAGPWRQRPLLAFEGKEVRVVTNRSRMVRFARGR